MSNQSYFYKYIIDTKKSFRSIDRISTKLKLIIIGFSLVVFSVLANVIIKNDKDYSYNSNPQDIGGVVWEDINGDGIRQFEEPLINEVDVLLFDENDIQYGATETTNEDGEYVFSNVDPGIYYIIFNISELDENYVSTISNVGDDIDFDSDIVGVDDKSTEIFTLNIGDEILNIDAGFLKLGSVSGLLWYDINQNGIKDSLENGIKDIEVLLQDENNGASLDLQKSTINGEYIFQNIWPGIYHLHLNLESSGYKKITVKGNGVIDNDFDSLTRNTDDFVVSSNIDLKNIDGGLFDPHPVIKGFVWHDRNGDGLQSENEEGIPWITVYLADRDDEYIVGGYTDIGGNYSFSEIDSSVFLSDREYRVRLYNDGFIITKMDTGNDDSIDSDFKPIERKDYWSITEWFNTTNIEVYSNLDAGLWAYSKLGGHCWQDGNMDGIQDTEEYPLVGVEVQLFYSKNSTLLRRCFSDINGDWGFTSIAPGNYYLKFIAPSTSFKATKKGIGNNELDSDIDSFGIVDSFFIFSNTNDNNIDAGFYIEPPLSCDSLPNTICEESKLYCNLWDMNQWCTRMPDSISTGNQPKPLCPNGGTAQNITWMSFIANNEKMEFLLHTSNCVVNEGQMGVQYGIYADCSFKDAVICRSFCEPVGDIEITVSGLNIGQTYYFFIDGCNGTVCDYWLHISGYGGENDIVGPTEITCDESFLDCEDFYVGEDVNFLLKNVLNAGKYKWTMKIGDENVFSDFTLSPAKTIHFDRSGEYTLCGNGVSDCGEGEEKCISFDVFDGGILSGYCWQDENNNGIQNYNEHPMEGVDVIVYKVSDGKEAYSVLSDDKGKWKVKAVDSDEYYIKFIPPSAVFIPTLNNIGYEGKDSDINKFGLTDSFALQSETNRYFLDAGFVVDLSAIECDFEAATECDQADLFCNLWDMNGLCVRMPDTNSDINQPSPLCPKGGSPNNLTWWSFVAASSELELIIHTSNCVVDVGGAGIQYGIYTDCSFKDAVICHPTCVPVGEIEIKASGLTIGQTYYFFVDGCNGTICDYWIQVLNGGGVVNVSGPSNIEIEGVSRNNLNFEIDEDIFVSLDDMLNATKYKWTISMNGGNESVGFTKVPDTIIYLSQEGHYRLCVQGINNCSVGDELCTEFNVVEKCEPKIINYTKQDSICYGDCSGSINVLGLEDYTGALQFEWSNEESTALIENLCAGDYSVTITDSLDCTYIDTFVIISNQEIVLNLFKTDETYYNANNGTAGINPNGGAQPYTFVWSNGATTKVINDLEPGIYVVTFTDSRGCTAIDTAIVNAFICNDFEITSKIVDPSCYNSCDGAIAISSVTNSSGDLTYLWSTGESSSLLSNICEGNYIVTITDTLNCSLVDTFELHNPDKIEIIIDTFLHITNQGKGSIFITTNNDGNLIYTWSGPEGYFNNTEDIFDLDNKGCYTLEVTDTFTNCKVDTTICINDETGIFDIEEGDLISVFPNPATKEFYLDFKDSNIYKAEISLFDISSKKMFSKLKLEKDGIIKIGVSELKSGLYFIKIKNDEMIVLKRVIIEK